MFDFTEEQIKRYARHIILPEVGGAGQKKISQAKILVIGAGGLGSPAIYYLTAAGVGTLGIVDFDKVDYSNLQRQIIHTEDRVGMSKVESAAMTVKALNKDVNDIILDGTDNFPTRFLINDACYFLGKKLVSAAMLRFEGQITVFNYEDKENSPCYRCLFPEPPPQGLVPTCQEAGILGSIGGIMGAIQATEALKLVIGCGEPLIGKLLIMDALSMDFRKVNLRKDKSCPLCGENAHIKELIEYEQTCDVHF